MHSSHRPDFERASQLYRTLAADGTAAAGDQLSLARKLGLLFATLLVAIAVPLAWAASAGADRGANDQAVLVKSKSGGDDDDDDARGGEDDDDRDDTGEDDGDDGTRGQTGQRQDDATGPETQAANTDAPGLETGISTKGESDANDGTGKTERDAGDGTKGQTGDLADAKTGKETQAQNTDAPGLDTGVSTKGETDQGDKTGKTERR
jgi:hypothetical protein